jgi:hypothetical protein
VSGTPTGSDGEPAHPIVATGTHAESARTPSAGAERQRPARRISALTIVAIVVVVTLVGSAVAYEAVTSKSPGNPCSSFTPQQLGKGAAAGTVTGNTTPNYAGATSTNGPIKTVPQGTVIQVVAGENFWGSLVSQMGGNLTSVLSIVSDPNADPHEYEANTSDAAAIANANFVIVNGVGYDDWALQLIASSNTPGQGC